MLANPNAAPSERLVVHRLATAADKFADDVRAGLTARPKSLPPKYFYDDLGSKLFEAICRLPEYYVTRAESEILSRHAEAIIEAAGHPARLLELGSGSAEKTRYLIDALLQRQAELRYLMVDISPPSLEAASRELLKTYPDLRITAYATDYFTALAALAEAGKGKQDYRRTIAVFLGSNIGNMDADESRTFLRAVRRVLDAGDALLLGADLKKSASVLVPAYDDALGVTAAFNLNLLVRINRELGGDFDVKQFAHRAVYNEQAGRIEMHLVSRAPQAVRLRALGLEIHFAAGETIHTENSYKFDAGQLAALADDTGFALRRTWHDEMKQFSFNLLVAINQ
ncbi:MAG TPA: L-histidine N(alpha)-methyltransferase [Blastocatellia bacterium]|nr:L-histidine N(alpha)-methyltransferase [Blastocatellia bacterium]